MRQYYPHVSHFCRSTLQRRHSGRDGVSNHQHYDCLLNRLFRRKSKKTSKLRVTGLCAGNSPVTDEFPAYRTSNAENVSIWWRHHDMAANGSSGCHHTMLVHVFRTLQYRGVLLICTGRPMLSYRYFINCMCPKWCYLNQIYNMHITTQSLDKSFWWEDEVWRSVHFFVLFSFLQL